ncbi:MAG: type II toxin-antitoxin system antitoxin DNA ADP-ribosyl glycohydrolase DarG, partial [Candidatus Methylomirabilales bacterium]
PTKEHWRSVSKLSNIVAGLEHLKRHCTEWGITSLAVPPLGCGEGGLEWRVVGRTLFRGLKALDIPVELYAPYGTPPFELHESFLAESGEAVTEESERSTHRIPPGWVALAEILARILREPQHWPVGRTTFQKLVYFATEAGIPTGLDYSKGTYGPFAEDLKSVITRLVNNGLLQEQRLGRMFAVFPGPTYEDSRHAFAHEMVAWSPIIERVTDLCLRFRTTSEAEMAATVHFAARRLAERPGPKPDEKDVLDEVKKWKQRRQPPPNDRDVALTIRALGGLGWVDVEPSEDLPFPEEELLGV